MADGKKSFADQVVEFANWAMNKGKDTTVATAKGGISGALAGAGITLGATGGIAAGLATVFGFAASSVLFPFAAMAAPALLMAVPSKAFKAIGMVGVGVTALAFGMTAAPFLAVAAAIGACLFGLGLGEGVKLGGIAGGAWNGVRELLGLKKKSDPNASQAAAQETAQAITRAAETPAAGQTTEQTVEANIKAPVGTTVAVVATLAELLKDSKITALETAGNKQEAAKFQIAAMEFLAGNYPHSAEAKAALDASIVALKTANGLDPNAPIAPAMKAEEFVNLSIADIQLIIDRVPNEAIRDRVQTAIELHMTDAGLNRMKDHRDAVAKLKAEAKAQVQAAGASVTVATAESLPVATGVSAAEMARASKVMDVVKNASILSPNSGATNPERQAAAQALIADLAQLEGKTSKDIVEMKDGAQGLIDKYRAENRENLAAKGAALMGMGMVQYNGTGELGGGRAANPITTKINSGELAMVAN